MSGRPDRQASTESGHYRASEAHFSEAWAESGYEADQKENGHRAPFQIDKKPPVTEVITDVVKQFDTGISYTEDGLRYVATLFYGTMGANELKGNTVYAFANAMGTIRKYVVDKRSRLYVGNESDSTKSVKMGIDVLQHWQLVIELIARRKSSRFGDRVVLAIELVKAIGRLLLLARNKGRMLIWQTDSELESPLRSHKRGSSTIKGIQDMYESAGRTDASPGFFSKHNAHRRVPTVHDSAQNPPASKRQQLAEGLYILRPLVFAALRLLYPDNQFWSWLASLALDVVSMLLHYSGRLSVRMAQELKRRSRYWLLYLVRPPIFEKLLGPVFDFLVKQFGNITLVGDLIRNYCDELKAVLSNHFYGTEQIFTAGPEPLY